MTTKHFKPATLEGLRLLLVPGEHFRWTIHHLEEGSSIDGSIASGIDFNSPQNVATAMVSRSCSVAGCFGVVVGAACHCQTAATYSDETDVCSLGGAD